MSHANKPPVCRQLTRTHADRGMLRSLYERSKALDTETMAAICKVKDGAFIMPFYEEAGLIGRQVGPVQLPAWRIPGFIEGAYVEPLEDDPCERAGARNIGVVHTHPKWKEGSLFSDVDLAFTEKGDSECIVYRKGKDLMLKCVTLKKAGYGDHLERIDPDSKMKSPEKEDPRIWEYWSKPCVTKVLTRRMAKMRDPSRGLWKSF